MMPKTNYTEDNAKFTVKTVALAEERRAHKAAFEQCVVFLSCPLVKKHADLSGSFLYSQSTMKNMYSKPTNRTKLSIPMKTKSIA